MNLNAPLSDSALGEEFTALFERTSVQHRPALSAFAPPARRVSSWRSRPIGIVAVVLIHAMLAALYIFGSRAFTRPQQSSVTVVQIPLDKPEDVQPLPPPRFAPPDVYVPQPIIPLITLEEPPPPAPNAITLSPPVQTPANPTAPLAETPTVPFEGDARSAYVAALFAHLNRYKRYPDSAKLRHEQGVVSLRFTINRAGHVLAASITKSSGSKALDEEALAAVHRADPLPRIPDRFGREQLDLVIPIEFVLH